MPVSRDDLSASPATLSLGTPDRQATYKRRTDLVAHAGPAPRGRTPLISLEEGRIVVVPGPADGTEKGVAPVYEGPGGDLAVATGAVFVRFAEGASASDRQADLRANGYRILKVPGYAPSAAWVEAVTGSAADALNGIPRLARLQGVEHVEPQVLRAAPRRE